MKNRDGEPIELFDLNGGGRYDEEAYVRGHVDDVTFREAVAEMYVEEDDDDDAAPEYGPIRHVYARWEFTGQDDLGNPRRGLTELRNPARGAFRVTAATLASTLRRNVETKAQGDRDVAELLARYPGVEIVKRNDYGRDYSMKVPGLIETVHAGWADWRDWKERRGTSEKIELHLWAQRQDAEAWERYRETVRETRRVTEDA